MTFQLDTTGFVADVPASCETAKSVSIRGGKTVWSDLTPFTQGYIEALPWGELTFMARALYGDQPDFTPPGFADLAPEALARVIADCDRCEKGYRALGIQNVERFAGFNVWTLRQAGSLVEQGYPPLTVQLGDDGKVRFG